MHANQTDVQKILGGVQQYVIPMFQRPYSWKERQWATLWTDLEELCEESKPRNHFIGSVVTMPDRSVPEGVSKFVLIDGQQRITTLLLLLAALRDKARREEESKLADKIDDLLLKNRHQDDTDIYKVLPTQADRPAFCAIMDAETPALEEGVAKAYAYFDKKLRTFPTSSLDRLHYVVCKNLVLVSIVLDRDDNPYLIFESLNAKGQPLTQADLIRNFFFMRLNAKTQETAFRKYWQPMQGRVGEHLTEFVRHLLMREGKVVKQGDIYFTVKERVDDFDQDAILAYLTEMHEFSSYYERLIDPTREPNRQLASRVTRLNRFVATTAYPFLLNVYHALAHHRISTEEVSD